MVFRSENCWLELTKSLDDAERPSTWADLEGCNKTKCVVVFGFFLIFIAWKKGVHLLEFQDEKSRLGVKGMVDKYVNLVAEKNKAPAKKALDLPKKQISESEGMEDEPPADEPEPEPEAAEVEDEWTNHSFKHSLIYSI